MAEKLIDRILKMLSPLTTGYLLGLVALLWPAIGRGEPTGNYRLDITERMQSVPTHCLAAGRACIASKSLDTGLTVNPANLTIDKGVENLWSVNIGNISEQMNRIAAEGQINRRQFQLGFAHGNQNFGIGLSLGLSRADQSIDWGGQDGTTSQLDSRLNTGNAALKFSLRATKTQSLGISFSTVVMQYQNELRNNSVIQTSTSDRYRGSFAQIGYKAKMNDVLSVAAIYRPETSFSKQGTDALSGDSDKSPKELVQSERAGIGLRTSFGEGGWLNFSSDIVATRVPTQSLSYESAIYLEQSDISTLANQATTGEQNWLLRPGTGIKLNLPTWMPIDMLAGGLYWEPYSHEDRPRELHRTWGIGRSYSIFNTDLAIQFAVDQAGGLRSYQINLL